MQLRGLLSNSIEAFVDFFEKYEDIPPEAPETLHAEDVRLPHVSLCHRHRATPHVTGRLAASLRHQDAGGGRGLQVCSVPACDDQIRSRWLSVNYFSHAEVFNRSGRVFWGSNLIAFYCTTGIVDHFVSMMNTIPRIESEMGKSSGTVSPIACGQLLIISCSALKVLYIHHLILAITGTPFDGRLYRGGGGGLVKSPRPSYP